MPEAASTISLKRAEAQERSRLINVVSTVVELDLTDDGPTFASTTTIEFGCLVPGAGTFLDFKGTHLRSLVLNGRELDPQVWTGTRIPLTDLATDNVIRVEGLMSYTSDGEGLHRHVDPSDHQRYLYAMSFLDAAPEWFACFDQPDLKSAYRFEISAPADWTVVGNGPSRRSRPGRWTITPPEPLSTYFVTLVAGPYASVYAEHDGIRLGFHVRESLGDQLRAEAADMIEVTAACLDYYHRVFGVRYPFGEYHQAFVPDFNAGAMENPGCVTFRDHFIFRSRATAAERASRAGVIAHEMAHMWFGDLVTMRWWDDLWLNESFAEYMAHRCCTEVTRYPLWGEFGVQRKDWGAVADQSPSTHPVAGNGAADAATALQDFDGISYAKGAAVLKQLVAYLGDQVFFDGLRRYFADYRFGNATFADLIGAWTAAGAHDLDRWAQAWLRTSGMDLLTVSDGQLLRRAPGEARRPHALTVGYYAADGTELGREQITLREDKASLSRPSNTVAVVPDADDETWARIRFGDEGFAGLGQVAAGLRRESSRVVVINAIRDAVRHAELGPRAATDLLLQMMPTETSDVILASVLRFTRDQLAGPYRSPADRDAAIERIDAAVCRELGRADPGSDRQLALFRVTVQCNRDVVRLRGQLGGRVLPRGLELDPELAWAIVDRLAVLTGDHGVIERQCAVDHSAAARVHAARARAGLPDGAAKDRAWHLLVEPSDLSAYELYATAEGFFQPGQTDLCRPYAARYFHEVPQTAAFRTGWVLSGVALRAYPHLHSTPDVLDLADRCLSRADLAGPVRRSLVDGTDRLRRAVRSRQVFAEN